jgi:hypothetical protein
VNSVFGNLGPVGLALVLTIVLIIGHSGGGKVKPLGWWPTLFLALLAGSAYRAAGGIFKIVPDFVGSLIGTAKGIIPGVTLPALALSLLAFLLFQKLTTRQVAVLGIVFFYLATGAGGFWSTISNAIANTAANLS